jgi:hypothetical protein
VERFESKNQDMADDIILTLKDVADILRVTPTMVRNWANTGELPPVSVGPGDELRFRINEVVAFLMEEITKGPKIDEPGDNMVDEKRLGLDYLVSIFTPHVDENKPLVMEELVPLECKYTELGSNS